MYRKTNGRTLVLVKSKLQLKIDILPSVTQKPQLKRFSKYDPPKVGFLKNLNPVICPNMEGGQGRGPNHPDGIEPLGSIH